jgi:hypothetical protein
LYNEAVWEWNKKQPVTKTYAELQTHFIEAQEQYEDEQANMQQAGFGAAVLVEAVQNVANMVIEKDGTTKNTLDKMMAIITSIQKENADLRSLVLAQRSNNTVIARGKVGERVRPPATDQGSYCWSHGYWCHKDHNSGNCKFPKPRHIKEATRANNMGSSQKGKPE